MDKRVISIFAGQGNDSSSSFDSLFDASSATTAGALLLSACHDAFHTELRALTHEERKRTGLAETEFPTPKSLLSPTKEQMQNPLVTNVQLFLVQALCYLASSPPFPLQNGIILGFSSGLLSASVGATSSNTLGYLKNAVEAFRVAFWIGLRTMEWTRSVWNGPVSGAWSVAIAGITKECTEDLIETFQNENRNYTPLSITALTAPTTLTVSGCPDALELFLTTLPQGSVVHKLTINALYHSSLLAGTLKKVLDDVRRRGIHFPAFNDLRVPIAGLAGDGGGRELVERVLDLILVQPIDWLRIVDAARNWLGNDRERTVEVRNFGPGSGLARKLSKRFSEERFLVQLTHLDSAHCEGSERKRSPRGRDDNAVSCPKQDPIAIVGMAVNMPGALNTNKLWGVLEKGINTVSQIPETRFTVSDYSNANANPRRRMRANTGNFIDGHSDFDAAFFRISPREAKSMDPQQRVLLHVAYEALENAGYVSEAQQPDQSGMGVWIGAATMDYVQNLRDSVDVYYSSGTIGAFLSGRISYALKLTGPSVVVNTACSSSLVAVHHACRALMNRDCSAALAGGVNVITSPDMHLGLDRGHFLSSTGQSQPFDASADGYARGEGCGIFVLKRLVDAIADNDNIMGVIRGIEVNQSSLACSITHPHGPTQVALLNSLLANAVVDPPRVSVVEAHAAGTKAGDPNEVRSVRRVLSADREADNPLYITSIKANIGHLEAASGAAGLAKLLLMLQHNCIPSQISLKNLDPEIDPLGWDNTVIATKSTPWVRPTDGAPRLAILNNYGAAGSNAALLLEEWVPPTRDPHPEGMPFVFGLSAKTAPALEKLRATYLTWLRDSINNPIPLSDLAYTATARRKIYAHRLAVTATYPQELIEKLAAAKATHHVGGGSADVIFVFSGQGGQYLGMGASIYKHSLFFRAAIDECHDILTSCGFIGILAIVSLAAGEHALSPSEEFQANQAAIFSVQYGLAKLWMSWGIKPAAVVGHSLGEYAALVVAEVLSLTDALVIIANRARYMVERCALHFSGMLAVALQPAVVERLLRSSGSFIGLSIACYNSPTDCVVAGPLDQLEVLRTQVDAECCSKTRLLSVPFGYHSSVMQALSDDLKLLASQIQLCAPAIPICSSVFGDVVMPGDRSVFTTEYFACHCVGPVLFDQSIEALLARSEFSCVEAWIEIGPHPISLPMLKNNPMLPEHTMLLGSLRKNQDGWIALTNSLSRLYQSDVMVVWAAAFSHLQSVRCVETPSYPFSKTSFWVAYGEKLRPVVTGEPHLPELPLTITEYSMLQSCTQFPSSINSNTTIFETPISVFAEAITGHKVTGISLCPVSVYLDQILSGVNLARGYLGSLSTPSRAILKDVDFAQPLIFDPSVDSIVKTVVAFPGGDLGSFSVNSYISGQEEVTHVYGHFYFQATADLIENPLIVLPALGPHIGSIFHPHDGTTPLSFSAEMVYDVIFPRVVEYTDRYQAIKSMTVDETNLHGFALVQLPSDYDRGKFVVHPVLLDSFLQVGGFIANLGGDLRDVYICKHVRRVQVIPELLSSDRAYTVFCRSEQSTDSSEIVADVYVKHVEGTQTVVCYLEGVHFSRVRKANLLRSLAEYATEPASSVYKSILPGADTSQHADLAEYLSCEILQVISSLCDVSITSLDMHTNLQDLGVDSLMSIELLATLQSGFPGTSLNSRKLLACHTVAELVQTIADSPLPDSGASSPRTLVSERDEDFIVLTGLSFGDSETHLSGDYCADPSGLQTKSKEMVIAPRLQHLLQILQTPEADQHAALFLFHDGSGLIHYYERLLPLGRAVWGIHNPRFGTSQRWDSVTQMATQYAIRIRETLPAGRVLLGGWSFGGVVAVETARQLLAAGYAVDGVILIDSPSPVNHTPLPDSIIDAALNIYPHNSNSKVGQRVKEQIRMNTLLLACYDPTANAGPYPALALLHSTEPFRDATIEYIPGWLRERNPAQAAASWEMLAGAPVKVWEIPGNHFQTFHASNIEEVSLCIAQACDYLDSR